MRVLRILTRPNLGGPMRQAIALWHAHRALGMRTLLVVGSCESHEREFLGDVPLAELPITEESEGLLMVPALHRGISPQHDFRARRAMRRVIEQFKPDVVHTHTSKAGWLSRGLARALDVPVVAHTYHGLVVRDYFPPPISWALRHVERRLARKTDLNFTVSSSCQDELREFGVSSAIVVPPAVAVRSVSDRLRKDAARAALGIPADAGLVLGFVGRLVPIKRVDVFLELVRRLEEDGIDVHAVVLGDGPMGSLVQDAVEQRAHLRWLGADPRAPEWMPAFDALVLPSRREGFPLVAVEAAAADVVCLGFDVPGVRDAVCATGGQVVDEAAGVDGLLAALRDQFGLPGSSDEQARSGREGDASAERMLEARAHLVRGCNPDTVAVELCEHYRKVLDEKARTGPNRGANAS